jgi:hypothetical protein
MAITIIEEVGIGTAIIATVIGTIIRLGRRMPGSCQHARQHKVAVGRAAQVGRARAAFASANRAS